MNVVEQQLDEARSAVTVEWTAELAACRLADLYHRRRRRRRQRRLFAFGAVVALAAGSLPAAMLWQPTRLGNSSPEVGTLLAGSEASPAASLRFADQSQATALTPSTEMVVLQASTTRISIMLRRGAARFRVAKRTERAFRVHAGEVLVAVVGTDFEVEHSGGHVGVLVNRGEVIAQWRGETKTLGAGDSAWFPPIDPQESRAESPTAARDTDSMQEPRGNAPGESTHGNAPDRPQPRHIQWSRLADRGRFAKAYDVLQRQPQQVRDRPHELLAAADVARLSGHPKQALPYLRRIVRHHSTDSRAPLAAFTLGRVLLDELGRPRAAAAAFSKVVELDQHSQLAQDALAREVEAWAKSGRTAEARERAQQYVERFPRGDRVDLVRKYGELP